MLPIEVARQPAELDGVPARPGVLLSDIERFAVIPHGHDNGRVAQFAAAMPQRNGQIMHLLEERLGRTNGDVDL